MCGTPGLESIESTLRLVRAGVVLVNFRASASDRTCVGRRGRQGWARGTMHILRRDVHGLPSV